MCIRDSLKGLEEITGKKFGDNQNPLLVSVRSGARQSLSLIHISHHQEQGGAVDLHGSGFAVGKAAQSIGCAILRKGRSNIYILL